MESSEQLSDMEQQSQLPWFKLEVVEGMEAGSNFSAQSDMQ